MHVNGKKIFRANINMAKRKDRGACELRFGRRHAMGKKKKHLKEFRQIPERFPNTILNDNDKFCFRITIKLLSDEFQQSYVRY